MYNIIDTHGHLFVEEFDDDRAEVMRRAREAGITHILMPNIDMASIKPMLQVCGEFPDLCYPMLGLHPTEVKEDYRLVLDEMKGLLCRHRVGDGNSPFIAIGEVGLDFYWDDTRKEQQIEAFERQIEWAAATGLPLVIHSRSAFDALYEVMERHRNKSLTGIFHCFSGSAEEARALLGFPGFMLGIGGTVTYKKSTLPQVLKEAIPLERIVLETDSPYLAPVPKRGRRNESAYIPHIAEFLSNIYCCDESEIARITTENAKKAFTKIN